MPRLLVLALLCTLAASPASAQSLAELAAQEKARRTEKGKKGSAPKVYTEEDLKPLAGERPAPASAPAPVAQRASPAAREEGAAEEPPPEEDREKSQGPEEEWRERHRQALAQVESANQNLGSALGEVERLKQDLNPMSTTFTTDPYKTLELQAQLTQAQNRAAEAQKLVEAAQQAADQVVNQARQNGVYIR
jgi:hypothetical protein